MIPNVFSFDGILQTDEELPDQAESCPDLGETAAILAAVESDPRPLALVIQAHLLARVQAEERPQLLQVLLDGASKDMDRIVVASIVRQGQGRSYWPLRITPEA